MVRVLGRRSVLGLSILSLLLCVVGCGGDKDGGSKNGGDDAGDSGVQKTDAVKGGEPSDAKGITCQSPDGTRCDDALACTATSTCQGGICTPGTDMTNCDDQNPCTDDSCEEPLGCRNRNNSAKCDDKSACTQNDHCQAGSCQGDTTKDCSSASDDCNVGQCDPGSGECRKIARPEGTACDDKDSCTSNDQCNAGVCVGSNACGPNASTCTPGTPNKCTCKTGFVDNGAGACVSAADECLSSKVCSPNATCTDASDAAGDFTCTCKPGFAGDGKACTAVDPCEHNPCGDGRGTCTAGSEGKYSCACKAGYVAAGNTCICDMNGTFAGRIRTEMSWPQMLGMMEGGKDTAYTYVLERHTADADGNLKMEITLCGSTPLDICGKGMAPILPAETYSQFQPVNVFDVPTAPAAKVSLVAKVAPGSPFVTPHFALLLGISLTDPLGAWPASRKDISGTSAFDGSAVNGATWIDHDDDAFLGITTYMVPPGGIKADGVAPDPIYDFGANSAVCPREGGEHTPYAYMPAMPDGLSMTPVRVKRFFGASRSMVGYNGKVVSCDEISGDIVGPDNGKMKGEARIGGCVRTNGESEAACSDSVIDTSDSSSSAGLSVGSASFKLKRIATPSTATCAVVRATNFD
jgi:hypothetical protein